MSIEYVKDDHENDNIITIKSQIDDCIKSFCIEQNITDLKEISQSVWNGLLMYINFNLFKNTNRLRNIPDVKSNLLNNNALTNYNSYNTDLCSDIADYYIYLCRLNDKECSATGYEYLTGITYSTLKDWETGRRQAASPSSALIGKKLQIERENSLSDKLLTGKNPVGVLGILNHFYGWSGVGNMKEDTQKTAATLADVRKNARLLSDNLSTKDGSQAEKSSVELCDNSEQLRMQ